MILVFELPKEGKKRGKTLASSSRFRSHAGLAGGGNRTALAVIRAGNIYIYIYIYICVCVCVCVYVYQTSPNSSSFLVHLKPHSHLLP